MTQLQKYRGKGKDEGKVFFRLQPYLPSGKRVTIRLGTGRKRADRAVKAIGDLIESGKEKVDLNASTKSWLSTADPKLIESLRGFGLIRPDQIRRYELWTIETLVEKYIAVRGVDKAVSTIRLWEDSKRKLFAKFGKDCLVLSLLKEDGKEFKKWLLKDQGLAENTAKKHLRHARSFFGHAIEDGILETNPFKARSLSVTQTSAKKEYISPEAIRKIIDNTKNPEWRLLFAMCRKIPLRVPSEINSLTWRDIDWEGNKILLHSPKTKHYETMDSRMVPLFPELKPYLDEVYFSDADETYVFPTIRKNSNPATYAKKLVGNADVPVWGNFFNSIRASAETDLMDEYGLRRACQWAGNSAATAMKNYALIRKEDFMDQGLKCDAKSDAINSFDAKSDAESASTEEHSLSKTPIKNAPESIAENAGCVLVGDTGLEPVTPCL